MRENLFEEILGDFAPADSDGEGGRCAITVWIPPEEKSAYDRLQKLSRRRFSKKVRETVLELISAADARVG